MLQRRRPSIFTMIATSEACLAPPMRPSLPRLRLGTHTAAHCSACGAEQCVVCRYRPMMPGTVTSAAILVQLWEHTGGLSHMNPALAVPTTAAASRWSVEERTLRCVPRRWHGGVQRGPHRRCRGGGRQHAALSAACGAALRCRYSVRSIDADSSLFCISRPSGARLYAASLMYKPRREETALGGGKAVYWKASHRCQRAGRHRGGGGLQGLRHPGGNRKHSDTNGAERSSVILRLRTVLAGGLEKRYSARTRLPKLRVTHTAAVCPDSTCRRGFGYGLPSSGTGHPGLCLVASSQYAHPN